MEPSRPPEIAAARPPQGLFVVIGLAGVVSAVGAAAAGFLIRFSELGLVEYSWGNTLRYAAIFALVGGMLALCQHEVGVPIVIGSSAAIVAVVGTVIAGLHLHVSQILDPYPVRGTLFIAAGLAGLLGIVFGLAGLRGRANAGLAVPVAALSVISLGMTAAVFHLDKVHQASRLRPFAGFALITFVCVVCSFVGRYGVFAAAVASASIISIFIDSLDLADVREPAVAADIAALALIITLGAAAVAVQSASPITATGDVVVKSSMSRSPVASLPTNDFAATADELLSGHPLIAPYEPTTAVPLQPAHEVVTSAVSAVGQWAADPYGRHQLRYWDGLRWTDHVQNNGVASVDPVWM